MRNLFCLNLNVLGVAGSIACSLLILPAADARRAYDSSGSSSQASPSTQNPNEINQFSPPSETPSANTSPSTRIGSPSHTAASLDTHYKWGQNKYAPPKAQYTPPQKYMSPQNQYAPAQKQYTPPQNQYQQQQGNNSYPQQLKSNGTNFYGISPEQISGGAAVHQNTYPENGGAARGGYDPRWNPNFGTGAGAGVMARESGGLAQSLRDNFPLPMNGDEAQMFQVNNFAARSNGGMQSRHP